MVAQSALAATPQRVLHTSIAHFTKPAASGAYTFTQYLVRVSDERSSGLNWTVYRRYSEFRNLKLALEEAVKRGDMCTHCAIMSKRTSFALFPHRRIFGNLNVKTLEARRIGLNIFLDAVAKHARTCRESMTCQTRPLMDKFLMVYDMRYTYLNVHMSEAREDQRSKISGSEKHVTMSGLTHRSVSMVCRTNRLSGHSDYREECVRSCTEEWTHNDSDEFLKPSTDPEVDQSVREACTQVSIQHDNQLHLEERELVVMHVTVPNLLAYTNGRRFHNNSLNDHTLSRLSLTSECERSSYKQPLSTLSTSRHSDPGLARNELLNFSRGSFSGGGRQHNAESRLRSRKVHLSSAAKRVKKLEEAEARFSVQTQTRKPKCLPRLATIPE